MRNKLPLAAAVALIAGATSSYAAMTITDLNGTAPSSGVFLSYGISSTNTKIENDTTDPDTGNYKARGQTFMTPDTGDAATQWGLTGITLQSHSTVPTPPSNLVIEIWSWGANANSLGDQGSLLGSYTGAFTSIAGGVAANDYVNLDLGATVALDENSNYAFLLRSAEGGPVGNEWTLRIGRGQSSPDDYADGLLFSDEGTTGLNGAAYKVYSGDDLVFYLHGASAIPEPSTALLGGLGALALLRRRRH